MSQYYLGPTMLCRWILFPCVAQLKPLAGLYLFVLASWIKLKSWWVPGDLLYLSVAKVKHPLFTGSTVNHKLGLSEQHSAHHREAMDQNQCCHWLRLSTNKSQFQPTSAFLMVWYHTLTCSLCEDFWKVIGPLDPFLISTRPCTECLFGTNTKTKYLNIFH